MTEQTLGNFYLSCDTSHRELYSVIIHEWQESGLQWQWDDRNLALGMRSVMRDSYFSFFRLQPGEGIYPASITLDLDFWRELIGQEETDAFIRSIESMHGVQYRRRDNIFAIVDPGHLSGSLQQQLRDQFKRFALRVPDLVAS